ncbi:integrase core domain-containing protein, partial [Thermincola ferriacetica]|uniref:integrase core domain-containing protein n=1 Tax=Thermincola ferriacetica TaxID=281456 RepID=UPI00128CC3E0
NINEFNSPRELRIVLNQYIHEYNTYRPHSSLKANARLKSIMTSVTKKLLKHHGKEDNLQNFFRVLTKGSIINFRLVTLN